MMDGAQARPALSGRGVYGVWVSGTRVADAQGLGVDRDAGPGKVLRDFAA